ncbi:MAG: hypothetical protein OIN85_00855 [Candidatus Methanoperedens sp.]|nr:hypothetical protein [Candidatus Methanoperedens sp.]
MSDSRAFVYEINPDPAYGESSPEEDNFVNQSSPSWVLTFIRWRFRDTLRINEMEQRTQGPSLIDLKAIEEPLVVRNDCVSVSVTSSKASYTPSMEATLLQTNVNYLTEICPGDFVFVNMLNWPADAEDVASRADSGIKQINKIDDGFKGFFKVQSVRRAVVVNPNTGAKTAVVRITGFAFTEFNNMIYFNQSVALQQRGFLTFSAQISEKWSQLINQNNPFSLRYLIQTLTESFIGSGIPGSTIAEIPGDTPNSVQKINQTPNDRFFMPAIVGRLLGIPNVTSAADIYNFVFGLQTYNSTNSNAAAHVGLNPSGLQQQSGTRFWFTPDDCPGSAILKPEYWDQVKAWDILNQYTNSPINEFYSCFKVAPYSDSVIPTVVFRQNPFTTEDFLVGSQGSVNLPKVTRFMTLPRWKINSSLIFSEDIGRDETARINYVQVFGKSLLGSNGTDYTQETVKGNFVQDVNDIQRSGLRPAVISGLFDMLPLESVDIYNSPFWAKILGDAIIGSHLKFNGTIVCAGIVDPITVGDNLQYDGVIYHIEQITHKCELNPLTGIKSFRTILSLSSGLSVTSSAQNGTIYPGMKYGNAYKEREVDFENEQILPGVSESQDIPQRKGGLDQKKPLNQPNKSFPQPKEIKLFSDSAKKPKKVK